MDVRTATCLKPEDTKRILGELEQNVGLVECNTLVVGLSACCLGGGNFNNKLILIIN